MTERKLKNQMLFNSVLEADGKLYQQVGGRFRANREGDIEIHVDAARDILLLKMPLYGTDTRHGLPVRRYQIAVLTLQIFW
jgi:hypothetical protein